MPKTQAEKDRAYKRKNAEDLGFVQIKIWVPEDEAEAIKEKYTAKRRRARERLRRINKHKAMNQGRRPAERKSKAEQVQDAKENLMTKLINGEKP